MRAIGKPKDACTFGEFADEYANCVLEMGNQCERIDVLFDRCDGISVKGSTWQRRGKGKKIHCIVQNRDVFLFLQIKTPLLVWMRIKRI